MNEAIIILVAVLVAMAIGVVVLYGLPLLVRSKQVGKFRRANGKLALTYDDGPDEVTTAAVLDLLDELGVKATFYLVGFRAQKNRHMLDRLKSCGHELGTHTQLHKNAWKKPVWFEYRDAMRAYTTLDGVVDRAAAYRPPFGKVTALTMIGMWLKGRRVEWWTVAGNDTLDEFGEPKQIAKKMLEDGETVVLMHCHHAEDHRRAYVLELTKALVDEARKRGIEMVTMTGLHRNHGGIGNG